MLRRSATIALAALAVGVLAAESGQGRRSAPAAPSVDSGATFVFTGRGWGHGVGMSQYGALGFAKRGWTYARILAHYYPGTQLTKTSPQQIRVLLAEGRRSITIASEGPFRVRDGTGAMHRLAAGDLKLGPKLEVKVDSKPAEALTGPLTFIPGNRPLQLGKPYRGWIQVTSNGKRLRAINFVGLEPYLYGVVPDEVPDTWPPEALKAQAVAARSYAVATRKLGDFDVYADTRSQVYGGVNSESFTTTAAIVATAGRVLTYRGRPAITYFFSTSGGRTAAIQDAWPGARPVPYLVSVPDPYDSLSPHHRWGPIVFSPKPILKRLRIPGQLRDLRALVNPSGRVGSVVAVTQLGELTLQAADVRRALGLRSTWFRVGVMSVTAPAAPVVYGSAAKLAGVARGIARPTLEQRVSGKLWEPAGAVSATADGTFTKAVKPQARSEYRLRSDRVASGSVAVRVSPLVRFALAEEPGVLRGMVRPVLRAAVQIQRFTDGVWRVVKTVQLNERANFEAELQLVPGTYRARVAPGGGFVPGVSPTLKVVAA